MFGPREQLRALNPIGNINSNKNFQVGPIWRLHKVGGDYVNRTIETPPERPPRLRTTAAWGGGWVRPGRKPLEAHSQAWPSLAYLGLAWPG